MTHRRFVLTVALTVAGATPVIGQPMTTAFTYQGRLADDGTPANGAFDLRLILFDQPVGGTQIGPTVTLEDVTVSQGLFTVVPDFGTVFTGGRRWLEIGVRPGASTGAFSVVSTRQEMTAAPAASFSATVPWSGIAGKPPGFLDNVDNDVVGGLVCVVGQVVKRTGVTWGCAADLDTTYTAGVGISIVGSTISIPTGAVGTTLLQDGGVSTVDLGPSAVTSAKIATGAVGSPQILNNSVAVADLDVADVDDRYLNATEELTSANYGGCGTYSLMNCGAFLGGQQGPTCINVPVGGLCRATGVGACPGATGGACGDGSSWYLKTGN